MNFEDIRKANEKLATMDIKGKDYVLVNERIKAFRMLYPEGFILTELVSDKDGVCIMRAKAGYYMNGSMVILGTGTAYEKETSSYINKTSYIENCETSAVGRALGMLALGIDTSVASAEEVTNAVNNQEPPKEPVPDKYKPQTGSANSLTKKEIQMMAEKAKMPMEEILKQAGVQTLDEMSQRTAEAVRKALQMRIQRMAKEAQNGAKGQTA